MPNTHSAERRMRNSARKNTQNRSRKSGLKSVERNYADVIKSGKKDEAATALKTVSSALDKGVKSGIVHRNKANRKKSRLAIQLNKMK
jgi:small subunit ribosomal protein S20